MLSGEGVKVEGMADPFLRYPDTLFDIDSL